MADIFTLFKKKKNPHVLFLIFVFFKDFKSLIQYSVKPKSFVLLKYTNNSTTSFYLQGLAPYQRAIDKFYFYLLLNSQQAYYKTFTMDRRRKVFRQ